MATEKTVDVKSLKDDSPSACAVSLQYGYNLMTIFALLTFTHADIVNTSPI